MPMPVPNKDESREDFISRFMGNPAMVAEYPDEKQRAAVANSQWGKKELKLETVNLGNVEIFEAGTWKGQVYTAKDIDQMVENFEGGVAEPFMTIDHSSKATGQFKDALQAISLGFVERLERKGNKLIAWFKQVPKTIADLIEAGALKKKSIEFFRQFISNGKLYKNVLQGVTFHGANGLPEVNTLSDVLNLYKSNLRAMDKDQEGIESLKNSDFKKEEIRMDEVTLTKEEYNELQKTSLKSAAVLEKCETLEASNEALKAENKEIKEESATLKAENEAIQKAKAEALKAEAQKYIAKQVNDGKIKPAHKDRYVEEYIRYNANAETFKSFIDDIESRGTIINVAPITTPTGEAEEGQVYDPEKIDFKAGATIDYDEIDKRIKAHASAKGISYEEASKALNFTRTEELGDQGVAE